MADTKGRHMMRLATKVVSAIPSAVRRPSPPQVTAAHIPHPTKFLPTCLTARALSTTCFLKNQLLRKEVDSQTLQGSQESSTSCAAWTARVNQRFWVFLVPSQLLCSTTHHPGTTLVRPVVQLSLSCGLQAVECPRHKNSPQDLLHSMRPPPASILTDVILQFFFDRMTMTG